MSSFPLEQVYKNSKYCHFYISSLFAKPFPISNSHSAQEDAISIILITCSFTSPASPEAVTSVINVTPCSPRTVLNFEQRCACAMVPPSHLSVRMTRSLRTGQVSNLIPSLALQRNISMRRPNSEYFLCTRRLAAFSSKPHKTSTSEVDSIITFI